MYECLNCGKTGNIPLIDYQRHDLTLPPWEAVLRCPKCKSTELKHIPKTFCGFCGQETKEGKKYCNHICEKLGEEYRKKQEEKRRLIQQFDVTRAIAEVDEYNRLHNTDYSYGKYFALKELGGLDDDK